MRWLLYITIVCLPFYDVGGRLSLGKAEISPFDGLVMLSFFFSLVALPVMNKNLKLHTVDYIVIIWCLLNILTLVFNVNDFAKELNQFRYYTAVPVALYFLTRLYTGTPKLVKYLCTVFLLAVTVMAVAGFVEFLQTSTRIMTTAGGAHSGAILFIGGALVALYLRNIAQTKVYRFVLLCAFGVIMAALFLTMARTLILVVMVIPALLWYLLLKRPALVKLFFIGLFVLGAIIPIVFIGISETEKLSKTSGESMDRMTDISQVESAIGVRVRAYSLSLDYISKRPLLGHGSGVYEKMYKQGFQLAHTHNLILEILLRVGILGLCVFIMIVYLLVKMALSGYQCAPKGERELFTLFLSLIAIVITNGFTNNIANLVSNSALWFYFAILASVSSYWIRNGVFKKDDDVKEFDKSINRRVILRTRGNGV